MYPSPLIHAINMSAPSRCRAAATKALPAARISQRTFASNRLKVAASSRPTPGGVCLRETQRMRLGSEGCTSKVPRQMRLFSQSAPRSKLKTIDQIRARNKGGVRTSPSRLLGDEHPDTLLMVLTSFTALQPHGRHPLRRSRRRPLGLLHIRERAHGAETHSRANQRHRQTESRRTISTRRPERAALRQRRYAGPLFTGTFPPPTSLAITTLTNTNCRRYTSASRTAQTSAQTNSTKWPSCTTK